MKETLFGKGNRKAASPTESAAGGNRYRERSGAGCLNGEAEASALGQHVTRVKCKSGSAEHAFDGRHGFSKRVVPRIIDCTRIIRPGMQETVFRGFFMRKSGGCRADGPEGRRYDAGRRPFSPAARRPQGIAEISGKRQRDTSRAGAGRACGSRERSHYDGQKLLQRHDHWRNRRAPHRADNQDSRMGGEYSRSEEHTSEL